MAFTYLLECSDGSLYAGSTRDLERRLGQHASGAVPGHTATRRPVRLVWFQEFERIDEAFAMEKRVQGWRRAKKLALIDGRLGDLPALASRRASGRALRS